MADTFTPPPVTTSGNSDQYIIQPPTQKDLESIAEVKMQYGNPTSTVGKVVPAKDALTKNAVWMAKKMKEGTGWLVDLLNQTQFVEEQIRIVEDINPGNDRKERLLAINASAMERASFSLFVTINTSPA